MDETEGKKPPMTELAQGATEGAPKTDAHGDWFTGLPDEVQSYIRSLRDENAKWRIEKRRAEEAAREAEEKRLEEQQRWQELAEKREAKIKELEPKAERVLSAFDALIESRLKRIPADLRKTLVDPVRASMDSVTFVEWLDANEERLSLRPAPNLEAGAGAPTSRGNAGDASLTDVERRIAQQMGVDPAKIARQKAKLSGG